MQYCFVTTRAVAWSLLGVSAVLAIVGGWLAVIGHPTIAGLDYDVLFCVAFLGFSVVGALVVSRVPRNPVGWLLLVQGLSWELAAMMAGYANYALFASDGALPAGRWAAWAVNWLYVPALGALVLMVLVFPDGSLLSRRWRPVVWLTVVAIGLAVVAAMLAPGPLPEVPPVSNPAGLAAGAESTLRAVRGIGDLVFTGAAVAAVVSLVLRFRRASGIERQQLKWLAVAGCVVVVAGRVSDALDAVGLHALGEDVFVTSLLAVPLAVGVAVLRYRLYDVDVVISKTVILGGLAVFITVVYLAVVVGIGAAVGRGFGSNVTLAVVATALVAVAFEPVRGLLHRAARRLVFGAPTTHGGGGGRRRPLSRRVPCVPRRRPRAVVGVAVEEGADPAEDPGVPTGTSDDQGVPDGRAVARRRSGGRRPPLVGGAGHGAGRARSRQAASTRALRDRRQGRRAPRSAPSARRRRTVPGSRHHGPRLAHPGRRRGQPNRSSRPRRTCTPGTSSSRTSTRTGRSRFETKHERHTSRCSKPSPNWRKARKPSTPRFAPKFASWKWTRGTRGPISDWCG